MSEQNEATSKADQPKKEHAPIKFGKTTYLSKHESSIPRKITDTILNQEQLPKNMPPLGSSIIEDFIIGKVKTGIVDPQKIADAFKREDMPTQINKYVEGVRTFSEALNWKEIFSLSDAKEVREKILNEMREMGMTNDQVIAVARMKADIGEGIGISLCSDEGVYASKLQAVRKAQDYIAIFGNDIPIEQIVKASMIATTGHELGHKVNDFSGDAINNIPADKNWFNDEGNTENKKERFAEYWGSVATRENPTFWKTRQREWIIHLAKVTQVWDTLSAYNSTHEQKIDLYAIFREINKQFGKNPNVKSLFEARRLLYGGNEVESYASPYPRDVIAKAVKPK